LLAAALTDWETAPGFADSAAGQAAASRAVVQQAAPAGPVWGLPLLWRGQLVGVMAVRGAAGQRARSAGPGRICHPGRQRAGQSAPAPVGAAPIGTAGHFVSRQSGHFAILNAEEIYNATYQAAGQIMPNDAFAIALLDAPRGVVEAVYLLDGGTRQPAVVLPSDAGLFEQVLALGQPLLIQSADDWPAGLTHLGGSARVHSAVVVPMRGGRAHPGHFVHPGLRPHAFHADDVPLLTTLANQAAAAIHNARLFEAAGRQARDLDVLVKAQSATSASLDLDACWLSSRRN